MALHLASLGNRALRQLRNGLFTVGLLASKCNIMQQNDTLLEQLTASEGLKTFQVFCKYFI